MSFSCGIVGLPNVGKSTIFNCLTSNNAEVSDYPFCTINPNIGVVRIPDVRLNKLRTLLKPDELQPETLKFIDIAGLVKGASCGEGLGNRFLAEIRQVDAILHVVRCFGKGELNPVEDVKVVHTELALSDLEMVERRLEKVEDKSPNEEKEILLRAKDALQKGIPLRRRLIPALSMRGQAPACAGAEVPRSDMLNFLTAKPIIYVANVEEGGSGSGQASLPLLEDFAKAEGFPLLYISALLESELQKLTGEEAEEFRREFGLTATALEKLITTSFQALQLITFYTVVGGKVNAWTAKQGTSAPTAAGKIHSDMERGFIKAEVVSFPDFERCAGIKQAKEKGFLRVEGRGYIVQDGDIIYFHFR